jgi:hypothetical protein
MKSSPRFSKLSYWSKLAAAGASSTTSPASASAAARATATSIVSQTSCGTSAMVQRDLARRAADDIGLHHAPQMRRQRREAALLHLPPHDPADAVIGHQRLRRAVGVGGLAVVDPEHARPLGHHLAAVRQPLEAVRRPRRSAFGGRPSARATA